MMDWFPHEPYVGFNHLRTDFMDESARQMQGRIAIVGLPGAGKKALFNSLWGWEAVNDSSETTRSFGLFTLIDLPLDPYDAAGVLYRLENADLILYVLDGREGLTAEGFNWITRLRSVEATLLVVLNHADEMPGETLPHCIKQLEERLARPVLPLSATSRDDIQGKLIPAMLKVCSDLAMPLANEIPSLRAHVARHIVLQSVVGCMTSGLDTGAANDPTAYMGVQMRMIRQIAAIYGYKNRQRYRERIGLALLLRWAMRLGFPVTARLERLEAWVRPGIVSAGITLVIGYLTILAYGGHLPRWLQRFTPMVGGSQHDTNGTGPV
ncbi:hypothetical protein FBR02_14225 [Anaerolineae bacterium CFX9]|jgi:tRNA U34 5-carboxymethylaminomethyl modifying GTPase MnmE/TrmE|nr:hypothetical protein [Anaerolineae bacterium CFX9]